MLPSLYIGASVKNMSRKANKWYDHKPDGVIMNANYKILWDDMIHVGCLRYPEMLEYA